jgi:single-strand DNA-binding protein
MNYVNLIGKMASAPTYRELENMGTVASFTVSTKEPYLDEHGNPKSKKYWHKLVAWGNSIPAIKEFAEPGRNVAIEGRLVTRFYKDNTGKRTSISEVEVNDFSIIP